MITARPRLSSLSKEWSVGLTRLARVALVILVVTASTKPSEIVSPGEQSGGAVVSADAGFHALILFGAFFAFCAALLAEQVQSASLRFVPFLVWSGCVTVLVQADLTSSRQVAAYASWILFYIAACALLHRSTDFELFTWAVTISVFVSALGGEIQYWLGMGPALGNRWPEAADLEFLRIHTGSGGILLDAFTPYCAAILIMSVSGRSLWKHAAAWLLVLWGTSNNLRGGMLAFGVAMIWYLFAAPPASRKRILSFMIPALVCGSLLFGGTIAAKLAGSDDAINTSGRLESWPQLFRWIEEAPIAGHGPDADLDLLARSAVGHDLRVSHNELLSTAVNYGFIGVVLLWGALLSLLVQAVRETLKAENREQERWCAATAILIMTVVLSVTDNTLRSPGFMIVALGPVALMLSARSSAARASRDVQRQRRSLFA